MILIGNMIVVGGTGRNIGKTTLVEKLIERLSPAYPITAVKMANIKPGNEHFHGHDVTVFTDKIRIEKEIRSDGNKDSMRFLKAGAVTSWYIQTEDAFLPETFPEIHRVIKEAKWVICESNSLRNFIRPALFIMVEGKMNQPDRKENPELIKMADVVVKALNTMQFNALARAIEIKDEKFILKESNDFNGKYRFNKSV